MQHKKILARNLICVTAYVEQLTYEELKNHKNLQELARYFSINTDNIVIAINLNEEEVKKGYIYVYSF